MNRIKVYGECPIANPAEHDQFNRVTSVIVEATASQCDWAVILRDFDYRHRAGKRIEFDQDWNGQFDMLVLAENKIIIYELKAFTVSILYGNTGPADWLVRRRAAKRPNKVSSYFVQASKQRAFFLQDYLHRLCGLGIFTSEDHFAVDSRLVFKSGSDISSFFHRIPMTENEDTFEIQILSRVHAEDDRRFVKDVFSEREPGTGKLKRRKIPHEEYKRLKGIFASNAIQGRTTKWFRVITEAEIIEDFRTCGSDGFTIKEEDADLVAADFNLGQQQK